MTESSIAFRKLMRWRPGAAVALLALVLPLSGLAEPAPATGPATPASTVAPAPSWMPVPRARGRLHAADIGLVINTADPYSVAVGEYYAERRGLRPEQVLRIELPLRPALQLDEFESLRRQIDDHFGPATQALALAWSAPYAVECQSITGVLALGFDPELCRQSCAQSRASPYANSASSRPFDDFGMRLSMLLAARDVDTARRLIDRGVAADGSLGLRGAPTAEVYLLTTGDRARNVRAQLYPPPGRSRSLGVEVHVEPAAEVEAFDRVLMLEVGSATVPRLGSIGWLDGGVGDHLSSFGGRLGQERGQTSVLDWIGSGATASYGTVSEPCNHLQKFPHPQWLLLHYLQGSTVIEAYWKSVSWPQQGLFVGEPLAAPFARR